MGLFKSLGIPSLPFAEPANNWLPDFPEPVPEKVQPDLDDLLPEMVAVEQVCACLGISREDLKRLGVDPEERVCPTRDLMVYVDELSEEDARRVSFVPLIRRGDVGQ